MITDEQIENILFRYTERQDEFNLSVVRLIADRVNKLADFDKLTSMSAIAVAKTEDTVHIKNLYANYKKAQRKQLHEDFLWIVTILYFEARRYYEEQEVLEANKELMEALERATQQAQAQLDALLNNPVFVLRDLQKPTVLRAYPLEQGYNRIINEASSYLTLQKDLRNLALKQTTSQLFDSGIRYAKSEKTRKPEDTTSADRAIRFNVLSGIKSFINKVQDIMGKQFGANGLELSAHIYPAPDHAPAQGHQFTKEEVEKMQSGEDFQDVNGNFYIGFVRQIGEWNCRHYFTKIKLGAKPQYSQEQLDKILADNERGYTTPDGKHYTLYECTQIQRRYERNIRKTKESYLMHKSLNDGTNLQNIRNRVGNLTRKYKQFSNACDLPVKFERIRVKDYK